LVERVLSVPAALAEESWQAVAILGLALPFVLSSIVCQGFLESYGRFRVVAILRAGSQISTFVGPLLAMQFAADLRTVMWTLVLARVFIATLALLACAAAEPRLAREMRPSAAHCRSLLKQGRWITVSNLVSPVLVYVDRFVVGTVVSIAAVAYYAAPMEIAQRMLILPAALMTVFFPRFAAGTKDAATQVEFFALAVFSAALLLMPLALLLGIYAEELLALWLGGSFAATSRGVVEIMMCGILVNGIARVPLGLVHAHGKAEWSAYLHMIELPTYLVLAWMLTKSFGLLGAAAAWSARVAVDFASLLLLSRRALPELGAVAKGLVALLILWTCLYVLGLWLSPGGLRFFYVLAAVTVLTGACLLFLAKTSPLLVKRVAARFELQER
jgi:O-antigen/teichoic acid export membrane protein